MASSIANKVVHAWELAQNAVAGQRSAALLAALSEVPLAETMALGVARRDAALLSWRAALFGTRWSAFAECPKCQAMLEYDLPVSAETFIPPPDQIEIELGGQTLQVNWPTSSDLAEAAASGDRLQARAVLLSRIAPQTDASQHNAILAALSAAHRSCWSMQLHCCACPHSWEVIFDPGEFLWREVRAAARRILREVDLLARTYHWSESEILAMSEIRRNTYLGMVQ